MKKENGITLIALVITIIILLILAAISLNMALGDNGIISKAQEAAQITRDKQQEEEIMYDIIDAEISKSLGEYDVWKEGTSTQPKNMTDKTIHIYKTSELKWLADEVNNGNTFDGYTVYLENNLDFGARGENGTWETETNESKKWTPIGSYNDDNAFRLNAVFEGNNYIIKGVYVNSSSNFNGIFGNASTIKNLTLKDSYISGNNCTAGIVGALRSGDIINCHVENVIILSIGEDVGGIVGQFTGTSIENCSSSANIKATNNYVGGIVGVFYTGSKVYRCNNKGEVYGNSRTGGIIGYSKEESATISECFNTGKVFGSMYTGGIAGLIYSKIKNCYNTGDITCYYKYGGTHAAGICGDISYGECTNCYNSGKITGEIEVSGGVSWSGGVNGCLDNGAVTYNCYNLGKVTSQYYGGVIGRLYGSSYAHDCYFLNTTAPKAIQNNVQGTVENCVSKTSDEMTSEILLEWLNSDEILWKKDTKNINGGLPILNWQ